MYRHDCCWISSTNAKEECSFCGELGIRLPGWGIGVVDYMARYVRTYGLKPGIPHRRFTSGVRENFRSCRACAGTGVVDHTDPARDGDPMSCEECSGSGYYFIGSLESFRASRDALLEQFPDARAGQEPDLLTGARVG